MSEEDINSLDEIKKKKRKKKKAPIVEQEALSDAELQEILNTIEENSGTERIEDGRRKRKKLEAYIADIKQTNEQSDLAPKYRYGQSKNHGFLKFTLLILYSLLLIGASSLVTMYFVDRQEQPVQKVEKKEEDTNGIKEPF